MYSIYLIENKLNGRKYVGITSKSIEIRFREHKSTSNRKNTELYLDMRKYGQNNFTIQLIEENISFEKGEEREKYWIAFYDTEKNGYNMTKGGHGVVGYTFTEDVKQKMRDSWCYEKIITPERNEKISKSNKGKKFSKEHRQKLSEVAKQRTGVNNSFYGKQHTQRTKNTISDANTKHSVLMIDKDTFEVLQVFKNARYAAMWIVENVSKESKENTVRGAITRHCMGIADCQTAYGFRWKYVE